jgi:hypothetical protein
MQTADFTNLIHDGPIAVGAAIALAILFWAISRRGR